MASGGRRCVFICSPLMHLLERPRERAFLSRRGNNKMESRPSRGLRMSSQVQESRRHSLSALLTPVGGAQQGAAGMRAWASELTHVKEDGSPHLNDGTRRTKLSHGPSVFSQHNCCKLLISWLFGVCVCTNEQMFLPTVSSAICN